MSSSHALTQTRRKAGLVGRITVATLLFGIAMVARVGSATPALPHFGTVRTFPAAARPFALAIGDQNRDGRPDVVVANTDSCKVSVLLNSGTASPDSLLAAPVSFAVGLTPLSVAMGDLNGDGFPDLVSGDAQVYSVSVLLSRSDGSYEPKRAIAVGAGPIAVAIADLNGDGKLDLAVANEASNNVSVLLGAGDGTFAAKQDYATGVWPFALAVGDLNADGHPDLAVANYFYAYDTPGTVSVLLGAGDGTFGPRTDFRAGTHSAQSVAIGDLNADGTPDLALAMSGSTVAILLGKGDGTFGPNADFSTDLDPFSIALVDLNLDGALDVATANRETNSVSVLMGLGDGTFGPHSDFAVGIDPTCIAARDLDGDGRPELVVANSGSNSVTVLFNAPAPPPQALFGAAVPYAAGHSPISVAAGDLNHDGSLDLAVANVADHTVSVMLGRRNGTFQDRRDFPAGAGPNSIAIRDLNGDGKQDLAIANCVYNTVTVLLGSGDGIVGAGSGHISCPGGATPWSVAIADVDRDGHPDLVAANKDENTVSFFRGAGDGSFVPRVDIATGREPRCVNLEDVNEDGIPDLTVAESVDNTVSVRFGNGDGTFGIRRAYATGVAPCAIGFGDFDGDGRRDLATANTGDNKVSVLLRQPDGSFAARQDYAAGIGPICIAVGDLDGDGFADIVVGDVGASAATVLLNDGGRTFLPKRDYPARGSAWGVTIADFNGDGALDVVTADHSSGTVSVLINRFGLPTPTLVELFRAEPTSAGIRIEWQLGDPTAFRSLELQRAVAEAGPWSPVQAPAHVEGRVTSVLDDATTPGKVAWYRLSGVQRNDQPVTFGPISVATQDAVIEFALSPISPNPCAGHATLDYAVPDATHVRLTLSDVQGRQVAVLADDIREPGHHAAALDASDLHSGIYFVRMQAGGVNLTRRLVIMK